MPGGRLRIGKSKIGRWGLMIATTWLCPNHHGLVHLAIDVLMVNGELDFCVDIDPVEAAAVMALARLGIQRLKTTESF